MKAFQIFLYIVLVLLPMIYFLILLKKETFFYKILVILIGLMSSLGLFLKFYVHINNIIYNYFIVATQVQLWFFYILFLITLIYRIIFKITRHKPFRNGHIVIIILAITLTTSGFVSHAYKREKTYHLNIDKQSSLSSLHLCVVSDFHIGTGTYMKTVDHFVERVNKEDYDAFLFLGDIFDENTPDGMIPEALRSFSKLHSKYGTYWITGNHEYYREDHDFVKQLDRYNIHYLDNEYVEINKEFNLVGFTDKTSHDHYQVSQVVKGMNRALPTITLDHNPERYEKYHSFTDVQFSGHTHNGQIFPGNLILSKYYKNSYGVMKQGHEYLVVTSGIGSWGFPFRLGTHTQYLNVYLAFH